jgi:hypothetical protein
MTFAKFHEAYDDNLPCSDNIHNNSLSKLNKNNKI